MELTSRTSPTAKTTADFLLQLRFPCPVSLRLRQSFLGGSVEAIVS